MKRYYILAKDNNHYMAWLNSGRPRQIIPELAADLPCRIIYINGDYILRGLSEINGFILPGANERPDYQNILDMINIIKNKQYNSAKQPTIKGHNITGIILDEIGG